MNGVCENVRVDAEGFCVECKTLAKGEGHCVCLRRVSSRDFNVVPWPSRPVLSLISERSAPGRPKIWPVADGLDPNSGRVVEAAEDGAGDGGRDGFRKTVYSEPEDEWRSLRIDLVSTAPPASAQARGRQYPREEQQQQLFCRLRFEEKSGSGSPDDDAAA